jgi:3D (Asp-Asp-Asp) domain-containing protein
MSKQTKKPAAPAETEAATPEHQMSCSGGWMVTGYYTPGEEEFNGPTTTITIPGAGQETFPTEFLRHVRIEGWGRTRHGWYLGFDRGDWVRGDAALNARGRSLRIGSLAVDRSVIPLGTHVRIPTLAAPWNQQEFLADDVGGGIHGAHVDVYCGAGPAARAETFRITADNMRVCIG